MTTTRAAIDRTIITTSSEETIDAGRALASQLQPPLLLILRGDLGAGKTTLVKGIAEALQAADAETVTSPTFTLVHEYQGISPITKAPVQLYHLDLYRLEEDQQLQSLGIEAMTTEDSLVLIEWGEKFTSLLTRANGQITLSHGEGDARVITVHIAST